MNKWRLDKFLKDAQAEGHLVSQYDAPEAMVIVKVNSKAKPMENYNRGIEVYGCGKNNPEIINRRKKVEQLFRQGITNTAEIASEVHIARSMVNYDLRVLRKTYPELRR